MKSHGSSGVVSEIVDLECFRRVERIGFILSEYADSEIKGSGDVNARLVFSLRNSKVGFGNLLDRYARFSKIYIVWPGCMCVFFFF